MWEFAIPLLIGGFSSWAVLRVNQSILRNWRSAAESCGLRVEEISSAWAWRMALRARAEPLAVRIEGSRHGTRVVVVVPGPPGFSGVRIRRESLRPRGAREIELGDKP